MKATLKVAQTYQFYIEFKVEDPEHFNELCFVFDALEQDKKKQVNVQDESEEFRNLGKNDWWFEFSWSKV